MSHALTPSSFYSGDVTVPDSGDARTAASVETPFQALTNRAAFARDALAGAIVWSGDLSIDSGGSSTVFAVSVGAIQSVVLSRVDGSSRALSAAAGTASGADISGGTLSSNTWYYLYAYDNSGSVSYEISATAPSSARVFKTGDVTRRYLGCFRTNGSGAPIPMRAHGGRFTYRLSAVGTDTQALSTSSAAPSVTDVALSSFVPPHTRAARVQSTVTSAGGATVLNLLTKGDSAVGITWRQQAPDGTTTYGECEIETDSSRVIQYTYGLSGGSGTAVIRVAGWSE